MIPEREQFCAVLATLPLTNADAIVLLCGEDAEQRADVAAGLLQQGVAPVIVCSGGLHNPPAVIDGAHLAPYLLGKGVSPSAVLVESGSQHTQEQAVNVLDLAVANDWKRLVLVASAQHMPRAYLTFVQRVTDLGLAQTVRLLSYPSRHLPWWGCPPGVETTRLELLEQEFAKIEAHQQAGHVARYADGLAYLHLWEGR